MCGIVGVIAGKHSHDNLDHLVGKMGETIVHRGPDSHGIFSKQNIGLGHRRLAILDLSEHGAQPMQSISGRYDLVYNGEIYNFLTLKKMLEQLGVHFVGDSDTEVLIAAIDEWGLAKTMTLIHGMFAFALWDNQEETLSLVTDRMGQKPLYYSEQGGEILFSSELKGLMAHPLFRKEIDTLALGLFFKYNYIPAPYSIFKKTSKLPPGHGITFDRNGKTNGSWSYWSDLEQSELNLGQPFDSFKQAKADLEKTLKLVLSEQMFTSVPYGAFLSGGIDSSLIVSLMQSISTQPVNTFSIGFQQKDFDEAIYAKQIAKHLGTNHTETYVTPDDALAVVDKMADVYCEPFSDSSQIPTYLVSQMARKKVTVCISGDGGDELFGGYNRHFYVETLFKKFSRFPKVLRKLGSYSLKGLSPGGWDKVNQLFHLNQRSLGDKLYRISDLLTEDSLEGIYDYLVSNIRDPQMIVKGMDGEFPANPIFSDYHFQNFKEKMFYCDQISYLNGDILHKVDRASMAHSLESRIPFLDSRVVELSWRVPTKWKIQGNRGKIILRDILYQYVPQKMMERPKVGFGVPMDSWLRNDLKELAESLLEPKILKDQGLINPQFVEKLWQEHQSGRVNHQYQLWSIMMFQMWHQRYL